MKRMQALLCVLVVSLWSCSSSTKGPSTQAADAGDETVESGDLEDVLARADSARALLGDVDAFINVRAELRATADKMARSYPEIRSTPEFQQLLDSIDELNSFASFSGDPHSRLQETDSLALALNTWPEMDSVQTETSRPEPGDSIFPYIENDRIDFWIRYFTGPGRDTFARALYRMQLYRPIVERIFDDQDLPHALIAVPIIESGFNMKARSYARAVGPWQFISGTARMYGLRMDWWYDERRDIIAATYAGTNYLKDLYGIWHDWPLALAAYNCGEYRVARAIARDRTSNFWQLNLPKQTERYVPKFLATLYILRDPEKYGFTIPEVESVVFDEVPINDATDLTLLARSAGTTVDTIKDMNPALLQWATPPKMEIRVKLPVGTGELCMAELAKIPQEERMTWRKHRVKSGETLSVIARNYNTSISALKSLNGLKSAHRIRAGSYLIVPIQGQYTEVAASKPQYMTKRRNINKATMDAYAKKYQTPSNHRHVVYKVKSGDTLGQIAEDFNTRASKIRGWNNLRYRSHIYPGQKLTIYVAESFDVSKAGSTTVPGPGDDAYVRHNHTVRKGDTVYSISQQYRVSMSDVMSWNQKGSSRIYPGQKLAIYTRKN